MDKNSKLVFDGKWMRIPLGQEHPNLVKMRAEVEEYEARKKEREKRKEKRKAIEKQPSTCGNCKYIRYTGIMEVKHEWGKCDMDKQSGRFSVKPTEEACSCWRRRSRNKMVGEQLNAQKWTERLAKARYAERKTNVYD